MEEGIRNKVDEFIKGLSSAMHAYAMYGTKHKLTEEVVGNIYGLLCNILAEKQEITIGIIGDEIAFEKKPFYDTSKRIKSFIEHLVEIGFRKITFSPGIERSELAAFCELLNVRPQKKGEKEKKEEMIENFNGLKLSHITIGEIGYAKEGTISAEDAAMIQEAAEGAYDGGMEFLSEAYQKVKGNQRLNVKSARQLVNGMINTLLKSKNMLLLLTSTRTHDENMFVHGVNVAVFSLLQAEALGLDKEHLNEIGVAALLHDIGKLSASPGEDKQIDEEDLTEEDKQEKADRNVAGAKILLETPGISPLAAIVAFEHDIDYDQSGYPKKLYGDTLNLASMMIAISDYYDKLRMDPQYQVDEGPEKIYERMMGYSGTKFHPDLLKNFFSLVGIYPPGTLVELDTKEVALVIQSSTLDIKRPQVEVLYTETGEKYETPKLVNLLEKDKKGNFKKTIIKSIMPTDKIKPPNGQKK